MSLFVKVVDTYDLHTTDIKKAHLVIEPLALGECTEFQCQPPLPLVLRQVEQTLLFEMSGEEGEITHYRNDIGGDGAPRDFDIELFAGLPVAPHGFMNEVVMHGRCQDQQRRELGEVGQEALGHAGGGYRRLWWCHCFSGPIFCRVTEMSPAGKPHSRRIAVAEQLLQFAGRQRSAE